MKTINLNGIPNMEPLRGTDEWYYSADYIHGDLYEAEEVFQQRHEIQSNTFYLIHYPDGVVSEPIPKESGQYVGDPYYYDGAVMLLAVHFLKGIIRIFRFTQQQKEATEIVRLPLSNVTNCYNLLLHSSPLMLTKQPNDNTFEIIWPEKIRFSIEDRESFNYRDGDKLYFSVWHEDSDYWEETVVRSLYDGTILKRYPGDIRIMPNGDKWLVR